MSKKLKYKIISCSSQQPEYPSSSLLFGSHSGGWQTRRFCTYPQQVTFEFYGATKIDKIEIVSDSKKIPSQVDILFYLPFQANGQQSEQRFQKYGYLNFNKNENSQLKQHKSIMVDIKCLYLRFLFHKPHYSKENFFSQIGIQQITVFGNDYNLTFAPIDKITRQIGQNNFNNADVIGEDDPFVVQKLSLLNAQKQKAVEAQDFETASEYKLIMEAVKKAGQQLRKLNMEKKKAIEQQDYEKANNLKKSIQKHRIQLDELISVGGDEENDQIMEDNEPSKTNVPVLHDFQDNEFVDPEINEMISKSGTFSSKGQNSRVIGGNSRLKINKAILKSERQKQNYDDRVVPAKANQGSKAKAQQDEFSKQEQNKELPLEPIDGKFIQYSLLMHEHFQQDTIQRFFSPHWQHKVQALNIILDQTKKKQNPNPAFIKSLIIAIKNSIFEVNFQVSILSLQLLAAMIKLNAKSNTLSRTNQITNDLDAISKEVVKKMSDNNNKIKAETGKLMSEMASSSLYGAEACAIAMSKTKTKTKLSVKQLFSRLVQLGKILQKNPNNQAIIGMSSEFAIQNSKHPATQVRNQALNLLILCKSHDSIKAVEKKIVENNLSEVIEAHQNKTKQKSMQKSKPKKSK